MNTEHFLRAVIAILALFAAAPVSAQGCAGDLTGNGIVDGADLGTILAYWGPRTQDPTSIASDLNGDGLINGADLGVLLASWGPCQSTITGITPNQGCIVGGTQVTISGTYLGSTSAVRFGDNPASSFTVVNQNTVQATTPAGAAGSAGVSITTAAGTFTSSQQFTYMPPSVTSIVPNLGDTAGGTLITIVGNYLGLTTSVTIGGIPCSSLTVVNANTITALTPPGTAGIADMSIAGGKGTITVPGGYRYVLPVPSWATLIELRPDPAVVTDPSLRSAIAATGLAWRVRDNNSGIQMVLIPPGTFTMGCIMGSNWYGCTEREQPVHQVTISSPFYLARYEITQAQWMDKVSFNPSNFTYPTTQVSGPYVTERPVESVSWTAVQGYLRATVMRLPTEAEWEYACRAGTQTPFYNGSTNDNSVGTLAWWSRNSFNQTRPVGGKAANGFGLNDMLGNVEELVSDWYDNYPSAAQTDPQGPLSGSSHVIRGGSFDKEDVRASYRGNESLSYEVGFRVAKNP